MVKKLLILLMLLLFLLPGFYAEDPPVDPQEANPDMGAIRSQLDVVIRQQAEFRTHLNTRLLEIPDKNYLDTEFQEFDRRVLEKLDQKIGSVSALMIASVLSGSILTVIFFIILRVKGLW